MTAHLGRRRGDAIERKDLVENQQPREFPAMRPSVKQPEASPYPSAPAQGFSTQE